MSRSIKPNTTQLQWDLEIGIFKANTTTIHMSYATAYDVENAFCAYKKHIAEI